MNTEIDVLKISENDRNFAKSFEDFVNGRLSIPKNTGWVMSYAHRYLQTQMFKVVLAFIRQLAINHHKRYYDDRNEWATRLSAHIYDNLLATGEYCDFEYEEELKVN